MSNKTQNTDNDYNYHSSRSGRIKCKFTKDFKRHKEDKHREENFWKRARKIRYQKQSRKDNYVDIDEPSDTESQTTVVPTVEPQATDLDLRWTARLCPHRPIVCPTLYTRPRFCDLLMTATPFNVAKTIDTVNDMLRSRFNGDAVFFQELGLWNCRFDDNGHQHPGSFEIRMMSDIVGIPRLMLVLTRTSGDNLDGDQGQDGYVETLGPNETFFRYIADKFDR